MEDERRAKYVMSVAAELVEMHPQTLRKYEREGLIEPGRYDGYHRMYSDDDLARLTTLRQLAQERGVNVAGLRILMEVLDTVERIEQRLERQPDGAAGLDEEVARLRNILEAPE